MTLSDGSAVLASRMAWRRFIPAVPAALTVLAAGAAFQRVFTWHDVAGLLVVSVVLGAAGGVAARLALTPPSRSIEVGPGESAAERPESAAQPQPVGAGRTGRGVAAATAVAAVVVGALISSAVSAAWLASPPAGSLGAAVARGVEALFGGWSRILTTTVPVPPTPDRLPLAAGLVSLATSWAVVAATRRRPGVDALAPAALVLVVALLLGVDGPGSLAAVAGPPLALAAVYLLIVSRPTGEGVVWIPPGRVLAAVATASIVLAFSLAVGKNLPLAAARQPVNLRSSLSPPVQLANTADPLDELPAWQRQNRTVMFTAAVDQAWLRAPSNWRLVSLDSYDGTGWSTQARATRAGQALTPPPGVSVSLLGPEVHVDVHIAALPGPWVPTAGVPIAAAPADLDFDPVTSDLVHPGPIAPGFKLSGRLSQPTRDALDRAGLASGAPVAALTAVPSCFPAALRAMATRATAGLERPDQQAVAIEQELASRGRFRLNAAATAGSNCARLTALAHTRSGTAEQFDTAFALMVRSAGLPSRLAVGFTPGAVNRATQRTLVTGADATVWPEVDLGRVGWVAFDPVPPSGHGTSAGSGAGPTTTIPATQQGLNQVRQTVAAAQSASSVPVRPATGTGRHQGASGTGIPWWLVVLLGVAAAGAAIVLLRLATRRRRRARRRAAPDPIRRLLGAWAEVLETLAGWRLPLTSLTPSEVSQEAARVDPSAGAPTRQLAQLVDQAVYAGVADDSLAAQAWACSDLAVRALVQAAPPGQRIRAVLVGSARARD